MKRLFADREMFRQLIRIAVPIALQNLLIFMVQMADTVMVGKLGEVQLSAVSLANQLSFVLSLLVFGLGSGSNVLIAQYWGKRDMDTMHRVMTVMYRSLLAGAALFSFIALCIPESFMRIFSQNAQVIATGAEYLRILGWSYLVTSFCTCTMIVFRSVGAVRISIVVYSTSLVVNVFFNWVLIFGKLGVPAMGVRGAAIATCIARVAELVVVLVYLIKFDKIICYRVRELFRKKLGIGRSYIKNSLPVVFNELLWGSGAAMLSVIIGRMGTEFTAANSVCQVLSQLVTIAVMGNGNAAAVIIGNTVGAGQYDLAKQRAKSLIGVSVLLGFLSMGIVFILKKPMISLYNISDLAKEYASQIITIYAFVLIFQAFSMGALIGVMRGAGDGRFVLLCDVVFLWLICIPMGFLSAFVWGWPVAAVYAVLKCDEVFKTGVALLRLSKGKWVRDLTQGKASS